MGRFKSSTKERGLADTAACERAEPEQTADHIINGCDYHSLPSEAGLFDPDLAAMRWLRDSELDI